MSLLESFIYFADRSYGMPWEATQKSVAARLRLADEGVCDPRRHPSYWCVPIFVGSYVGASPRAVLHDTEAFVRGCVMRHLMFEPHGFDASADDGAFQTLTSAYEECRIGMDVDVPFDVRFTAKCLPWTVLLALGTRSILAESTARTAYDAAMNAIVLVHSCLQMIDDWHDQAEDSERSHWNMWADEPRAETLAVIEPLLCGSRAAVGALRPHLLRTALGVQLRDTAAELGDVVSSHQHARA